jgi:hypothetical protein
MKSSIKPVLTAAVRRQIATALGPHLAAHLSSSHPTGISLDETSGSDNRRGKKNRFVASAVLPVYVAQLHQLARAGVANLQAEGFLLLVRSPAQKHLLVEVSDPGQVPPPIRVISGATVKALERALITFAARPSKDHSSLSVLRVPALHLYAVCGDIPTNQPGAAFVPFTPNFAGVKPGRRYTLQRFDAQLRTAAIQCILRWYEGLIMKQENRKAPTTQVLRRPQTSASKSSRVR